MFLTRDDVCEDDGMPIRVLLVDDEPDMRMLVRLMLERTADIDVIGEAASGEEAVDQAVALSPDCLLLDYMMPGSIDGIETTRRIRSKGPNGRQAGPGIVMFTAWSTPELRELAVGVGVDRVLSKDEFSQVAAAIREASGNSRD
jgi:two-component system, NarL family, nitrate/nitrite response regulator NarL